jgi:hypothetical protein
LWMCLILTNLEFGLVSTFLLFRGRILLIYASNDSILSLASTKKLSFSSKPFVIFLKSNRRVGWSISSSYWVSRIYPRNFTDFLGVTHVTKEGFSAQSRVFISNYPSRFPFSYCGVLLLFSRTSGLRRGFATDRGQRPVAFHPLLMFCSDNASALAL